MNLTILGCAGGIGGREQLTTCLHIDDDVLIDAGTGASILPIEALIAIDHVFLTHSHLDHVAGLALLADAVLGRRSVPVVVHATPEVIDVLARHVFNWSIWPDFTQIPTPQRPTLAWEPLLPGETLMLGDRSFTPFPVDHTVPTVAYRVVTPRGGFVFSGDLASTPALWRMVEHDVLVRDVLVDCSFPDAEARLALISKHYSPSALLADLQHLRKDLTFRVTHLKPGSEDLILDELHAAGATGRFVPLRAGERFSY